MTCASVLLAFGVACSAKPNAKADSPDTGRAAVDKKGGSRGGEVASEKSGVKRSPVEALKAGGADSSTKLNILPGRTQHDTVSLRAAMRLGSKMLTSWPAPPTPLAGSVLPNHRIVAFYGNPLSKKMGVLGEYPVDEMLAKLDAQVAEWQKADPSTPVQPALHLIAVVAQGAPGKDGMYRLRMDTALIEKVYGWAQQKHALLFLDVQVGKSNLQAELPRLLPFLARPDVHLGIDPEFSMHYEREGLQPGKKIGEMSSSDVNYAIRTLSNLVAEKHLPPKILIVHRFTRKMVLGASDIIRNDPKVQVVMNMDGWGPPWLKFDSYRDYIDAEPVQYTGFKLFYHNDPKKGDRLLTPVEVLHLRPRPLYIQYQ